MEHLCSDARKTLFFVKLLCGAYVCRSEPVLCPSPHSVVTPVTSHRSKIWEGGSQRSRALGDFYGTGIETWAGFGPVWQLLKSGFSCFHGQKKISKKIVDGENIFGI